MIKIAHRGNVHGPNTEKENSPEYLLKAIDAGFDVEIDVWLLDDSIWFGHDEPQYGPISTEFVDEIADHAWFHCKNFEALAWFKQNKKTFKYFWHEADGYTLTSNGYIWTYPGMQTSKDSILVELDIKKITPKNVFGVCSDYVGELIV